MKNDMGSNIATCDFRWTEYTPDGTKVPIICGQPLQNIGEFNGICPNWNKHTQGNDLADEGIEPAQTSSNPPTPTSINEILEQLEHPRTCGVWETGYLHKANPCNCYVKDFPTALYTLIASVRPKNVPEGPTDPNPDATNSIPWETGYNQALQDYDNAIKGLFDEQ